MTTTHLLDNPIWSALSGPQAAFSVGNDFARRFPSDVAPFAAIIDNSAQAHAAMAELISPGDTVATFGPISPGLTQSAWAVRREVDIVQMILTQPYLADLDTASDTEIERLGMNDVPEMLDLVAQTQPGPFKSQTIQLGRYWSIRREGRIAAMAGERLQLDGYCEVSAACTLPPYQRLGLARRLVRHAVREIMREGVIPVLHVFPGNAGAIALYESLGFSHRAILTLRVLQRM